MTDKEMLELAAKAAGYIFTKMLEPDAAGKRKGPFIVHRQKWTAWNPLTDDAAAFRLAVRLGINLEIGELGFGDVQAGRKDHWACEWLNADDPFAATRRAITRAAAEIGRSMA